MISREELERQAFQLIHDAGGDGILQIEMRKILGADSREGSRIALKFLEREVIKRRRELHEGRWTYRLFSLKNSVTFNSIMGCPCTACDDMDRCAPGRFVSPLLCKKLTYWIELNERYRGKHLNYGCAPI